jgi:hypothetical protein
MLDSEQSVRFWGVIPLKMKHLALISAAWVLVVYSQQATIVYGLFALTGCLAALLYVRQGLGFSISWPRREEHDNVIRIYPKHTQRMSLNPLKWFKKRQEDKKLKEGIIRVVPFGQVAARLKRADAEKLYTVAKRYNGSAVHFDAGDGQLQVTNGLTGDIKMLASLPLVGGSIIFEYHGWTERQVAHFINVILVRGQSPDVAFTEAESLR